VCIPPRRIALNNIVLYCVKVLTLSKFTHQNGLGRGSYSDGVCMRGQVARRRRRPILRYCTPQTEHVNFSRVKNGHEQWVSTNNRYCRSFGRASAVRLPRSSAARQYLGNGGPSGRPTLPGHGLKPVGTAARRENRNGVSMGRWVFWWWGEGRERIGGENRTNW